MGNPRLGFDAEGLDPRVEAALDAILAPLQTWFDTGQINFRSDLTMVQPRARYFLVNDQTIADNTDTAVEWTAIGQEFVWDETQVPAVHYDNGAPFGHAFLRADGQWLTPPVTGQYLVIASVVFVSNATGRRDVWLEQRAQGSGNSVVIAQTNRTAVNGSATLLQVTAMATFVATGTAGVRLMVYQNRGGTLDLNAGFDQTWIQLIKVS